ncbi:TolC family protein [Klebsiella pneumoniae]
MFRLSFMFIALLTAGCVSLDPHYDRPAAPVPATLPGAHGESTAVVGDWQKVVNDARLKKVVSIALNSNRDVQKALADIEAARAQYGETRASLFPTVDAELSHTRSKTVASGLSSASQADGAVSSFELDLFGKNQSLSRAARETWLASEFTAQNTRLTMIADLTTAWVTLATDNGNLALAQQTMDSAANSRNIVARQMAVGTASAGDLSSAESVYQQARASVASYRTLVAQDKNAINLLAGETVPESLLPGTLESLGDNSIALVPAGVSSSALLRYAEAEKKGLIATYEKSIQSAFKDVADALARRETLSEELDAQRQYVAAEQTSLDIAMKSYQAGVGDYLSVLTAQRTLWSAKTTLLSLQQTDLNNRITLWQSLGGGAS